MLRDSFTDSKLAWFFNVHSSAQTVAFLVLVSELPWFLMCTLLVMQTGLSCFSGQVGLIFNVHSSADPDCGMSYFRM